MILSLLLESVSLLELTLTINIVILILEMYEDEELPDTLEWYKDQIAGHHPSVVKNGIRQIGMFYSV